MATQIAPSIECPNPRLPAGRQGIARVAVDDLTAQLIVTFERPIALPGQAYVLDPRSYGLTGGQRLFPRVVRVEPYEPPGTPPAMQARRVRLALNGLGDFSIYTLTVNGRDVDPFFASHKLRFRLACDAPFDCRPPAPPRPTESEIPVAIDYLAKDYAGFRQALLDFIPTRLPAWTERSEADLGMMLLELFAATADQLSYFQDRVANEAFLDSATQRRSVAGHLALIGYEMDQGASASTWLQFRVKRVQTLPTGPGLQVSNRPRRANEPGRTNEPIVVFETLGPATLRPEHNSMSVHTWGNEKCCLTRDALSMTLAGSFPDLQPGDYLIIHDGREHRDLIRVTARPEIVPVDSTISPPSSPLSSEVTVVRWSRATPLTRDFCIDSDLHVLGNVVPATHGETVGPVGEEYTLPASSQVRQRVRLRRGPLAHLDPATRALAEPLPGSPSTAGTFPVSVGVPAREPRAELAIKVEAKPWEQRSTLLESRPDDQVFRVEIDDLGDATVVFGDNTLGRRVPEAAKITATYRVGGGSSGNLAADTLVLAQPPEGQTFDDWLENVTNPLPAVGGRDPESRDHARRFGPPTFQKPLVAVSAEDYQSAAQDFAFDGRHPIQRAKAAFRWTGSWLTVTLTVDPRQAEGLDATLRNSLLDFLDGRRLAGYDLEVIRPLYVPVELVIEFCLVRGFRADDVQRALEQALGAGDLPDGRKAFFHPDNFSFGENLYVSRLFSAIMTVAGVDSARITRFGRSTTARPDADTIANLRQGYLEVGGDEIIRLDNDPNFPENGTLAIRAIGVGA